MIGQQRNILTTMGVDLWIPRELPRQKNVAASIWRDQFSSEVVPIVEDVASIPKEQAPLPTQKHSEVIHKVIDDLPVIDPVIPNKPVVELNTGDSLQQQTFTLEAYCLEQVILLVESSQFTQEQSHLWQNIQSALTGTYTELKWPFPLPNFRDGRGMQAYIQGFLDALAPDKRILILGKLDFVMHVQAIQLAGLQEMIEQPLLKRRLWQLMQSPRHTVS